MSHHINFASMGWEKFEDLCTDLWFDEGYTDIKPYGRRAEQGRDAVFTHRATQDLILFQYKRWTGHYSASEIKAKIEAAAQKIAHFKPTTFILNSACDPNPAVNDWIPDLRLKLGFDVIYCDRSWIDLRLDNRRQDLRRSYFNINLEHHTWDSLLATSSIQVSRALRELSPKFSQVLYVKREIESDFEEFIKSDRVGLVIVDRSGRGKTNLLCAIASQLAAQKNAVVLLRGDATLTDDYSLERLVSIALDYGSGEGTAFQSHLKDLAQLLRENNKKCYILLDGISEGDNRRRMARALRNLLLRLSEFGTFQLCVTCRDVVWPAINLEVPKELLYTTQKLTGKSEIDELAHQLTIGDFSEIELEQALLLYSNHYNVHFIPTFTAKNQLRHPLLLRIFCETNQGKNLGSLATVPTSSTFEHYLNQKTKVVAAKVEGYCHSSAVLHTLINIAKQSWQNGMSRFISETDLGIVMPSSLDPQSSKEVIHLLEEEGVLSFREQPLLPQRTVQIVFDELHEYLRLKYLISELPDKLRTTGNVITRGKDLLDYLKHSAKPDHTYALLSLIGMILPETSDRREFLHMLLEWDFYTFCSCITRIPPAGKLTDCTLDSLSAFGGELQLWYGNILSRFTTVNTELDPLHGKTADLSKLYIEVFASPGCKEISYQYTLKGDPTQPVKITQLDTYPTMQIDVITGSKVFKLHNPDEGIFIPIFRSTNSPTRRIINFSYPQFRGVSLNVPERIALYDVLQELKQLVQSHRLPYETVVIIAERARATARSIPGLDDVEGLTLTLLRDQSDRLLNQFEQHTRPFVETRSKIAELWDLLNRLPGPLEADELPKQDLTSSPNGDRSSVENYSDRQLQSYLAALISIALPSYKVIVENNFSEVSQFFNIYAQLPFSVIAITDRKNVRYFFVPVDNFEDVRFHCYTTSKFDLSDSDLRFQLDNTPSNEHIEQQLERLSRHGPSIHMIDLVEPIGAFFSPTPINDIVTKWLTLDLNNLFTF